MSKNLYIGDGFNDDAANRFMKDILNNNQQIYASEDFADSRFDDGDNDGRDDHFEDGLYCQMIDAIDDMIFLSGEEKAKMARKFERWLDKQLLQVSGLKPGDIISLDGFGEYPESLTGMVISVNRSCRCCGGIKDSAADIADITYENLHEWRITLMNEIGGVNHLWLEDLLEDNVKIIGHEDGMEDSIASFLNKYGE